MAIAMHPVLHDPVDAAEPLIQAMGGEALAEWAERLDDMATSLELQPLMSYFSADADQLAALDEEEPDDVLPEAELKLPGTRGSFSTSFLSPEPPAPPPAASPLEHGEASAEGPRAAAHGEPAAAAGDDDDEDPGADGADQDHHYLEQWFSPADGLSTVRGLIAELEKNPHSPAAVLSDLRAAEAILALAATAGTTFHFSMRE